MDETSAVMMEAFERTESHILGSSRNDHGVGTDETALIA